jgi:translation initiation factor IF-2
MLNNSKKLLAIATAAIFLATPFAGTAAAAELNLNSTQQVELAGPSAPGGGPRGGAPSGRIGGPSSGPRGGAPGSRIGGPEHRPNPDSSSKPGGPVGRPGPGPAPHRPAPPPSNHRHHSSNDKLIGGLVIGAILGSVITNNANHSDNSNN